MSVEEIQTQITKLNAADQFQVEAFLKALRLQHSPEFKRELAHAVRPYDPSRAADSEADGRAGGGEDRAST